MSLDSHHDGMTRRDFLRATAASTAGLAFLNWPIKKTEAVEKYPHWGEVVVVRDDAATEGANVEGKVVRSMLDEAVRVLTDGRGWPSLFPSVKPEDTVGIKVNTVARWMTTHWELVEAMVENLVGMGFQAKNIIVWDTTWSTINAPLYTINKDPSRLRVMGTDQLKDPYDRERPLDLQGETAYLSRFLTQATHLINAPILKEHFEAGVTFALKNHVGSVDNAPKLFHEPPEKGNFIHSLLGRGRPREERIALINSVPDIQKKTRLIVGDALFGIYEKGPTGNPQFTYNGLIVGTDPVATDHQAWVIINEERVKRGKASMKPQHVEYAAGLALGAPIPEIKPISVSRSKK